MEIGESCCGDIVPRGASFRASDSHESLTIFFSFPSLSARNNGKYPDPQTWSSPLHPGLLPLVSLKNVPGRVWTSDPLSETGRVVCVLSLGESQEVQRRRVDWNPYLRGGRVPGRKTVNSLRSGDKIVSRPILIRPFR